MKYAAYFCSEASPNHLVLDSDQEAPNARPSQSYDNGTYRPAKVNFVSFWAFFHSDSLAKDCLEALSCRFFALKSRFRGTCFFTFSVASMSYLFFLQYSSVTKDVTTLPNASKEGSILRLQLIRKRSNCHSQSLLIQQLIRLVLPKARVSLMPLRVLNR